MGTEVGEAPGWFVDPWRLAPARWWDGATWSDRTKGWWGEHEPQRDATGRPVRFRVIDAKLSDPPSPADLWQRWPAAPRRSSRRLGPRGCVLAGVVAAVALVVLGRTLFTLTGVVCLGSFFVVLVYGWIPAKEPAEPSQRWGARPVIGKVVERWAVTPSAVTATPCVWWAARLERRRWWGWRQVWEIASPGCDFNLVGADGSWVWVHVKLWRFLRRREHELLNQSFRHDDEQYRVIEWGLRPGDDLGVDGPAVDIGVGEWVLTDGWWEHRPFGSRRGFILVRGDQVPAATRAMHRCRILLPVLGVGLMMAAAFVPEGLLMQLAGS